MIEIPICPYCNTPAKLADSIIIYKKKSYGNVWICGRYPQCDSFVGCHPDNKPLGRMANKELREAKKLAHCFFDPLWLEKAHREGIKKKHARNAAYKWLADQMGIKREDCHIGMFDVALCLKVAKLCKPYALKLISSEVKPSPKPS